MKKQGIFNWSLVPARGAGPAYAWLQLEGFVSSPPPQGLARRCRR